MNQSLIDQLNQIGQSVCTQPTNKELISLRELKARNFLATQSSRHFKMLESKEPMTKKQPTNIHNIQYKFQIKDDNYHSVLQQIVKVNQRPHLMPPKIQFATNHQQVGLSIGRQFSKEPNPRQSTLNEIHRTQRKQRDSHPEIDDARLFQQLKLHTAKNSDWPTERSKQKDQRPIAGTAGLATRVRIPRFEVDVIDGQQQARTLSQKQFNMYKSRKLATPTLAIEFKKRKNEEQQAYKQWLRDQEEKFENSFFDML